MRVFDADIQKRFKGLINLIDCNNVGNPLWQMNKIIKSI